MSALGLFKRNIFVTRLSYKHKLPFLEQSRLSKRFLSVSYSLNEVNKEKLEEMTFLVEEDESPHDKEMKIEKIRNKSRLKESDRNVLFEKKPYSEPQIEYHATVKYNRRLFGKYGIESGVNPGISWPTKSDLLERREYERVAFPLTIQELVESAKKEVEMKELKIQQQHERVVANIAKLDLWKKELKAKIAKKEAEAIAAKEKKQKIIEEVRRHFGFTVDPKDDRFKEMLAAKEKEYKKKEKQARIEEKERKAIAKLMSKHESSTTELTQSENKLQQ